VPAPALQLYRPRRQVDRWILRADVNVAGERIELQANASSRLADQAKSWWNQWAQRFAKRFGVVDAGMGVFADVPAVASAIGHRSVVPRDDRITAAAQLYFAGAQGDACAHDQIVRLYDHARFNPASRALLEDMHLIELALFERHRLPMRQLLFDAAMGSPHAQKVLCALYQVSEDPGPVRLSWWVDDYVHCPDKLMRDACSAAGDEVYARLVTPTRDGGVRRVAPGAPVMQATYSELVARGY